MELSDDPDFQPRRTIPEYIDYLKNLIETAPRPIVYADWQNGPGTKRIRHKPTGCTFEWSYEDWTFRGRPGRRLVMKLVEGPADIEPQKLRQIGNWASFFVTICRQVPDY